MTGVRMATLRRTRIVPPLQKPYRLMGGILRRQDRDLVLNLCQYGMGNVWEWGKEVGGHSWRTAGDLGGSFQWHSRRAVPRRL